MLIITDVANMRFAFTMAVLAVAFLQQGYVSGKVLKQRVINRAFIAKSETYSRKELLEIWKDMIPDPEAVGKTGVMGKSKHIINGEVALRGQYPYQVMMILDEESVCGGSIISTTHILSAAHCVEGVKVFLITLGLQDVDKTESGRVMCQSNTSIMHPYWDTKLVKNDIAIVYLTSQITYTNYIQPIRLPKQRSNIRTLVRMHGIVSGFGRTSDDSANVSKVLRYIQIRVVPLIECKKLYGKESVTRGNICIQGRGDKTKGTCNGDSGGPMVLLESDGIITLTGLVSYGAQSGCGLGYPDVLTRVSHYLSWIFKRTGIKIRK